MSDSTPRVSLGEAAYRLIRDDIISCRLAPGQRLTEKQLAATTGFGISPLRDALTRLDHDGLLRTLPRKGYQVAPLTPKSVDDLFDVWSVVGPETARRAVTHASESQIHELRDAFTAIKLRVDAADDELQDPGDLLNLVDNAFLLLAEASGNDYLVYVFTRLCGDMHRVWRMILGEHPDALHADPADFWVEHILSGRDADAAAQGMTKYIAEMHDRVLGIFARWPSVMSSEVIPLDLLRPESRATG